MGHKTHFKLPSLATNCCILALAALVCLAEAFPQQQQQQGGHLLAARQRAVFARRAADDSRPLPRSHPSTSSDEPAVVVGKFRAPAPEQVRQQRIPKMNKFGSQTMTASFRVADNGEQPEKIVHGILGASSQMQAATHKQQRTVGAKIQVSDEGLNYPPSKLSADIYGNVAEIVTAPPEAVESDFLIPTSSRFQQQQQQRPQQRQPRNARRYL